MTKHADMQDDARAAAIAEASRRSLLGAAAAIALLGMTAPASAKRLETEKGKGKGGKKDRKKGGGKTSIQVAPQRVESGRSVEVSGKGYPPSATGSVHWDVNDQWLANFTTNRKGAFKTRVTIPSGLPDGGYKVSVRVWEEVRSTRITVAAPPPPPPPDPPPGPTPNVGRAWGIFHPSMPQDPSWLPPGDTGLLGKLTRNIGATPGIVMWYQAWGLDATKSFNPALLAMVRDAGSVPMITWEPWNPYNAWDERFRPVRLLQGDHDGYIRSWAEGLKAYGGPVMLRWGHEANGFWYPWAAQWGAQPGDPPNEAQASQYVRSWKRIRQIFRDVYGGETTNISWVWCPNIDFTGATPFSMIYPGSEVVDWTGLDGYNWYSEPERAWKTFGDIFAASLGILRTMAPGKPVIIGEVASHEDGEQPDRKADWIRSSFIQEVPRTYPEVRAFVWFNEDKERVWAVTPADPGMPWDANYQQNRIRSLAAFRDVAASRYWGGVPLAASATAASDDEPKRARRARD